MKRIREPQHENTGDNIFALIGAEVVLPSQWRPRRQQSGEKLLAMAVLEQAVNFCRNLSQLRNNGTAQAALAVELRWFESDSDEPFSLRWICEMLDLDADAVRESVALRCGTAEQATARAAADPPDKRVRAFGGTVFDLAYQQCENKTDYYVRERWGAEQLATRTVRAVATETGLRPSRISAMGRLGALVIDVERRLAAGEGVQSIARETYLEIDGDRARHEDHVRRIAHTLAKARRAAARIAATTRANVLSADEVAA